jgi:hypothetical protein
VACVTILFRLLRYLSDWSTVTSELPDLREGARQVLGEYLRDEGFEEGDGDRSHIEFVKDKVFLHFSYYPEDASPRGINIGLGLKEGDGPRQGVGAWSFIPAGTEAQSYSLWKFANELQLEASLVRIRDEVLSPFVRPHWRNPNLIATALRSEWRSLNERHRWLLDERRIDAARRAFAAGDFQAAVDGYVLAEGELPDVDAKRLRIARREVEASS